MEVKDPVPSVSIPVTVGKRTVMVPLGTPEECDALVLRASLAKSMLLAAQQVLVVDAEIIDDDAWRLTPAGLAAIDDEANVPAACEFHGGTAGPAACWECQAEESALDAQDDENGPMDDEAEQRRVDAIRAGEPDPAAGPVADPEPPLEAADIADGKLNPDPYRLWANGEPPGLAAPDLVGGVLLPAACDPDALCRCGHNAADHHLNVVTGERVYCNACRDVGACDGFSPAARMLALVPQAADQ